jgi:hypothetical protein
MKGFEFKFTPGAVDGFSTESFQKHKDALSDRVKDHYSDTNRMPKKAFKAARQALGGIPSKGKKKNGPY